jgi:hypothetical protein
LAKNENEINMLKELDIMRADAFTILSDQVMTHGQLMMEIELDYHAVVKWGNNMTVAPRPFVTFSVYTCGRHILRYMSLN